jgi:hypothetical protein
MSDTPLSRFGTARDLERDEGLTPEVVRHRNIWDI